jgi:hypothetical protein
MKASTVHNRWGHVRFMAENDALRGDPLDKGPALCHSLGSRG